MYNLVGKVILMNAPIHTGKDVATDLLCMTTDSKKYEFKDSIFNIALAITGLSRQAFFLIYNDREKKETPQPEFLGMSPRAMMIWISEDVCKPKFGQGYFGVPAANRIDLSFGAVFSDSGFDPEAWPVAEIIGPENLYVVRFTRNGAKFEANDSRDYLKEEELPPGVNFLDTTNDGTLGEFCTEILEWVTADD